jgi:hypothetical protein
MEVVVKVMERKSLVIMNLNCIIGIFLGIGASLMLIKDSYWLNLQQHQSLCSVHILVIIGIIFNLSLAISAFLTLKLKEWARILFVALMLINLFSALIAYSIVKNNLPYNNFVRAMYPFISIHLVTDYPLFRYIPESFFKVFFGIRFFLSIGLPTAIIFYLTRPNVKKQFIKIR